MRPAMASPMSDVPTASPGLVARSGVLTPSARTASTESSIAFGFVLKGEGVAEHHRRREYRRYGIRDALPCDVRGRSMNRFI